MQLFRFLWLAVLSAAMAVAFMPQVTAQGGAPTTCDSPNIGCCGDIQLILLNPDLQPDSQGFIRASGQFFVQFQAIGERAEDIATFGFSFGAYTTEFPEDVCDLPSQAWFTGQQILNYRADTDGSDGFFINLQTQLVPDGQYTAALHAYDASDNEMARFWASAIVDNCDDSDQDQRCGDDATQMQAHDFIQPWPIVLPGDGLEASEVEGFTVEFAEELSELVVTLNGDDITAELEPWEGRLWDNDLKPGYGPNGLLADTPLTQECSTSFPTIPQVHECTPLGEAYRWTGRTLTDDDVLRIEATDAAGVLSTKDLHIGSGVTSGAISAEIPILEWSVDQSNIEALPGETALFRFTIVNRGGETGHPFADQQVPAGWDYEWQPPHVPVPSGSSEDQEFLVKVPANATSGPHQVTGLMKYMQQGVEKTLRQDLRVTVFEGAEPSELEPEGEDESEGSPAVGALAVVAAVGVAAVLRRRRT